jgi:hypothetical protein
MFRNKKRLKVLIIDNFLSYCETESISKYLKNREWFFVDDTGESYGRYKNFGFHKKINNFSDFSDIELFLVEKLRKLFDSNDLIEKNIQIRSVYYNAIRYGDKFKYHTDGTGPTFLIYCNENWKWWWGAETKIKNYGKIKPKPGRLLVFPGNVHHKACPMNFLSNQQARFSIVFQSNVF